MAAHTPTMYGMSGFDILLLDVWVYNTPMFYKQNKPFVRRNIHWHLIESEWQSWNVVKAQEKLRELWLSRLKCGCNYTHNIQWGTVSVNTNTRKKQKYWITTKRFSGPKEIFPFPLYIWITDNSDIPYEINSCPIHFASAVYCTVFIKVQWRSTWHNKHW